MAGKSSKTTKRIEAHEVTGTSQGQCEAIGTSHSAPCKDPILKVQGQVDDGNQRIQPAQKNTHDSLL